MMDIDSLAKRLCDRPLTNILVAGYIDESESMKHFHPMFDDIYFDFTGVLLRASSIDQFWHLGLDLVERVECRFQIEEGDDFGVCPLDFVLQDPAGSNRLKQIIVFRESNIDATPGKTICAALTLHSGGTATAFDTLFLDPRNEYGIRLGTQAALIEWRRANSTSVSPAVEMAYPPMLPDRV